MNLHALMKATGVINTVKCMFAEISDTKTDFCTVQKFQFKGIYKIVALLMPDTLKNNQKNI